MMEEYILHLFPLQKKTQFNLVKIWVLIVGLGPTPPKQHFFYSNFFDLAIFVGKTIVQHLGKTKQQTTCQKIEIKI
jgi:hypothetical protein